MARKYSASRKRADAVAALWTGVCIFVAGCANVESRGTKEGMEVATELVGKDVKPFLGRLSEDSEAALVRGRLNLVLDEGPEAVFKALETIRPKSRWRVFTTSDVKQFVRLFEEGSRTPERYFDDPKIDAALRAEWLTTPVKNRVFVAGANEDLPLVGALRDELKKQGKVVFFYKFCGGPSAALCDSTTVGAFFGSSGAALLAVSPSSAESRYVPFEIAAALNAKRSVRNLLLVTPTDVINAAGNGTTVRIAAVAMPQIQTKQ